MHLPIYGKNAVVFCVVILSTYMALYVFFKPMNFCMQSVFYFMLHSCWYFLCLASTLGVDPKNKNAIKNLMKEISLHLSTKYTQNFFFFFGLSVYV